MRSQPIQGVAQTPLEVLVKGLLAAGPVLIDHRFVQDAPVAGLLQVGSHAQDQPQRVVVEIAADVVVAALGERLVLVIGAPRLQLRRRQVQNALAGALGDHVYKAQQILVGITEAHAAPDP